MGLAAFVRDRLVNVMSGQGTTVDRRNANARVFIPMTEDQAEAAYRGSWLARKICDVPPLDMTREWRGWQADDKQIEAIEKEERRLGLKEKAKRALILSRIYGGGAWLIGTANNNNPDQELTPEQIAKDGLRYVRVMSPRQLSIGEQRLDPEDPYVDQPLYYELQAMGGRRVRLHPSRVIPFIGQRAPEGGVFANLSWFWGDPVMQSIGDAIDNADTAQAGFAALIDEAKLDIIKMKEFTDVASSDDGEQRIINRLTASKMGKSTWRALLLDSEDEWQQRQVTWAGIPDVMMAFLNVVAGAADIPVTRLLGQSPKGLQSTGDGEERDYHSMIRARQDELLAPALDRIDELLIRSALGARPEEIYYEFNALSELSEKEAAEVDSKTAQTLKTYGDTGLIHEEALAEIARNKMIETGRWPGCEAAFDAVDNALAEKPDPVAEAAAIAAAKMGSVPANENTANAMQKRGAITAKQRDALITDASPRPLYVRRNLVNSAAFLKWAKAQDFTSTVPAGELHVTVLFSRAHVDWLKMGSAWSEDDKGQLRVAPGGARLVEKLGDKGAVVLLFSSSQLSWRHEEMVRLGASHDYDDYQPHVTITYEGGDVDLDAVEPYRGELIFGPEIFEEVDDDWSKKLVEDK